MLKRMYNFISRTVPKICFSLWVIIEAGNKQFLILYGQTTNQINLSFIKVHYSENRILLN